MAGPRRNRMLLAVAGALVIVICTCATVAVRTPAGRHITARAMRWLAGAPSQLETEDAFTLQAPELRAALEREAAAQDQAEDEFAGAQGGRDPGAPEDGDREGRDEAFTSADAADTTAPSDAVDLVQEMKRTSRPKGLRGVSYLLLLGTDKSHPRLRGRTDAMILVAFRDRDGAVAAFSVPRDLWVEIPDLKYARINSVARVGDIEYGSGKGIPLLKKVLELELGVKVDHYALVDFSGFRGVVDALGGVEIDVPCPIADCFWSQGRDAPCVPLDVPAGLQHLDGATALMYARSRHGRGDFDRSRRQQAVLGAIVRKLRAGGLSGIRAAWDVASPYLETDLDVNAALYYASFALENDVSDLRGFSFASSAMTRKFVTDDRKHVLLLDHERFDAAIESLFERSLPSMSPPKRCPAADVAIRG